MRRGVRDVVVGTVLALAMGATATALLTHDFDDRPHFNDSDPGSGIVNDPNASGNGQGTNPSATGTVVTAPTPRPPATAAERRLASVYRPFADARDTEAAYSIVTLPQLGGQFPLIGFIPGDRVSKSPGEVSVDVATPQSVVLATRDGAGCAWLREVGNGPEVAHAATPTTCAGASPPLDGWAPIAAS